MYYFRNVLSLQTLHLSQIEYSFPILCLFLAALPQHSDLAQRLKSMYTSASQSFWPLIPMSCLAYLSQHFM